MIRAYARDNVYALPGLEAQDLENEVLEVLWMACNTYDPNKGMKFNTWFRELVKRRFLDLSKAARRIKRAGDFNQVSLDVESVRMGIETALTGESAEDEALLRIDVREMYRSGKKVV